MLQETKAMMRNCEGYADPTAGSVIAREKQLKTARTLRRIKKAVHKSRAVFDSLGFEVVGRIVVRDKATGRIWG